MKSIIVEGSINWLWKHRPDVAAAIVIISFIVWVAIGVNNFGHRVSDLTQRVTALEVMTADINNRQLPEIREELKDIRLEMDARFDKVDARFDKIELSINTVITYLAAKDGK